MLWSSMTIFVERFQCMLEESSCHQEEGIASKIKLFGNYNAVSLTMSLLETYSYDMVPHKF